MEREAVRELESVMERTGEIARKLESKLEIGRGGELGEKRLRELVWLAKISMAIFSSSILANGVTSRAAIAV